jgi:hypothetical protein
VDLLGEIERLVAFEGRSGGTDAERRAATHLAERLAALGRDARVDPIRVWPAFAQAQLLHAVAGVVGSVLSVYVPLAGFALVLLAAVSTFGDLTGAFFPARLPFGARASQNVVSIEDEDKPGRLILVASYDARRGGALYRERLRRWADFFFWALLLVLVCTVPRLFGIDPTPLTVIQFLATVVLIAAVPLFIDATLTGAERGENWNASGVAAVLDVAERYGGRLEHFDLIGLLTGASHPVPLGMRAWLRRNRDALDPEATVVVVVESAGHGTPHYATKEGLILASRLHPTLVAAAGGLDDGKPFTARSASGAYMARSAGLAALRVSALGAREFAPDSVEPDAIARTTEFVGRLVERIDEEIGPRLA